MYVHSEKDQNIPLDADQFGRVPVNGVAEESDVGPVQLGGGGGRVHTEGHRWRI